MTDVWAQGHEQVVFCQDEESGLRAIVALWSTALGPGLGGTRFRPYPTVSDAVADVLDLSKAMAYKNALAGLDHGGGKAVIVGDPRRDKTEPLLRAYGRFVASLGGRYVTACDVGTYVEDMDEQAVRRVLDANVGVRAVASTEELVAGDLDVYAPCALGHALTEEVARTLRAGVVCGGANNQLATPEVAQLLADRDVLYCPDYCVNAGGGIQVAGELHGFSFERARGGTERIYDTTLAVLRTAADEGVTPADAADRLAERRMREVGGLSRIHLPA